VRALKYFNNEKAILGGGETAKKQHDSENCLLTSGYLLLDPEASKSWMLCEHRSKFRMENKNLGDGVVTGSGRIDGRLVLFSARFYRVRRFAL
jgi:acetyl-CoA carboxylase carboxyltransferase component